MGETGRFRKKRKNFAQVSNIALQDTNLSLGAKGLYALIESLINIPDFVLYKATLMKMCKEGRKAFDSAWKSLKEQGYLIQYEMRDEKKCIYYEYELLDEPLQKKKEKPDNEEKAGVPFGAYGSAGDTFSDSGKQDSIIIYNKNNTNKNNNNLNNKSSVVVNDGTLLNEFDEEKFLAKIKNDKERYLEVGILELKSTKEYEQKLFDLFKTFSYEEVRILNNLPASKAFDVYYSYMRLNKIVNFEDHSLIADNPEGYIRGMIRNLK